MDYRPSKGVVLLGFSVVCFSCQRFCDVSSYVCSDCFSLGWFAELQPFGEELFTSLTICVLVLLLIKLFPELPFLGFVYFLLLECS